MAILIFLVMLLKKNPLTILIMTALKKPLLLSQVKVVEKKKNGSQTRKGRHGPRRKNKSVMNCTQEEETITKNVLQGIRKDIFVESNAM